MTSSSGQSVNPLTTQIHDAAGDVPLPGGESIDPGVARLWAAIVALDLPDRSRPAARLSARQRCALHQL